MVEIGSPEERQSGSAGPPFITAEGFLEVLIFPVRGFVIWEKNAQILTFVPQLHKAILPHQLNPEDA